MIKKTRKAGGRGADSRPPNNVMAEIRWNSVDPERKLKVVATNEGKGEGEG